MTPADDNSRGALFVISGPSGSGKTSIVARLRDIPGVFYSVSVTSRTPREGETDGVDYRFVPRERFEQMVEKGELAEHAEVAGNLYGTPRKPLEAALSAGQTALVDIDVQGAMQVKAAFPEARLIFIRPPDMADLEKRLRKRATDSDETIEKRLALAAREMKYASKYDISVVNDDLERAVAEVKRTILGQ